MEKKKRKGKQEAIKSAKNKKEKESKTRRVK